MADLKINLNGQSGTSPSAAGAPTLTKIDLGAPTPSTPAPTKIDLGAPFSAKIASGTSGSAPALTKIDLSASSGGPALTKIDLGAPALGAPFSAKIASGTSGSASTSTKIDLGAPALGAPALSTTAPSKIDLGAPALGAAGPTASIKSAAGPAISAQSTPASPSGSSILNFFGNKTTKDSSDPKMLQPILNKNEMASKLKPILGNAPSLQKGLEEDKEYQQKKRLHKTQVGLVIVFFLAMASVFYFYSELTPSFNLLGQNTMARLADLNKNVRGLQSKLNKFKYLSAQLDLNRFSYISDKFLDKVAQLADVNLSDEQKDNLNSEIDAAQEELPSILQRLQDNLGKDLSVKTYAVPGEENLNEDQIKLQYENDLREALKNDRSKVVTSTNADSDLDEFKLIDNTLKLVGNSKLINLVKSTNADQFKKDLESYKNEIDPAKKKALQTLIASILATTRSDISTISTIKNTRINWSNVIKQIGAVTRDVDPSYGSGVYEATGMDLNYTGYDFDTARGRIVLSGNTKTKDALNFTLISQLIDKLEESPYFKDVEMRSFSKSGSAADGYVANFKVDLNLENAAEASQKIKKISIFNESLKQRTGFKRFSN